MDTEKGLHHVKSALIWQSGAFSPLCTTLCIWCMNGARICVYHQTNTDLKIYPFFISVVFTSYLIISVMTLIRFLIFSYLLWWYDVDGVCCYPLSSHIVTLKSGSEVSIPTFSGRCTWRKHLQKVVKECLAYLIIKSMFVFQKKQQNESVTPLVSHLIQLNHHYLVVQAENASRVGVAQNSGGILYGPLPTSTTRHCSIFVGPANMRILFYAPRLQCSLTRKS